MHNRYLSIKIKKICIHTYLLKFIESVQEIEKIILSLPEPPTPTPPLFPTRIETSIIPPLQFTRMELKAILFLHLLSDSPLTAAES